MTVSSFEGKIAQTRFRETYVDLERRHPAGWQAEE